MLIILIHLALPSSSAFAASNTNHSTLLRNGVNAASWFAIGMQNSPVGGEQVNHLTGSVGLLLHQNGSIKLGAGIKGAGPGLYQKSNIYDKTKPEVRILGPNIELSTTINQGWEVRMNIWYGNGQIRWSKNNFQYIQEATLAEIGVSLDYNIYNNMRLVLGVGNQKARWDNLQKNPNTLGLYLPIGEDETEGETIKLGLRFSGF